MTLTSGASAAGLARGHDAVALRHLAGRYPSEPAGWQAVGLTVEPKVLQALARAGAFPMALSLSALPSLRPLRDGDVPRGPSCRTP